MSKITMGGLARISEQHEPNITNRAVTYQLGVDALVSRFAGFATDYFKVSAHPLEAHNRGTLFLPFEASLQSTTTASPMRIVVAALNGPDLEPRQSNIRFKAMADFGCDGRVATKFGHEETTLGRGGYDHMQAFNTLEMLLGDLAESPDRLYARPMPFPCDLIETDIMPLQINDKESLIKMEHS